MSPRETSPGRVPPATADGSPRAETESEASRRRASAAEGELLDLLTRAGGAPWEFDFYQLIRRVEALASAAYRSPGVGRSSTPREDPVRFGQEASLAFAPRTISGVRTRAGLTRVAVNFMGLLGPQGPMPLHFTEYVRQRELHHQDPTWARFLEVFQHRMVSLLYRAWAMNRPAAARDATATGRPELDRFATYVGSLFGLGMRSLLERDATPDDAKRMFAGRLANQTRSAEGLRSILRDWFGVPVRLEEFVGRWSELPDQYRTKLGGRGAAELGRTAIAGSRIWECQSTIRLILGPMGRDRYERVLPGSEGFERLKSWIRLFGGLELGWEVVLVLKREETPEPRLGRGVRLGYSTWVSKGRPAQDPADVVLRSE